MNSSLKLIWADLHNHNEVGYGRGTLKRSYQIAQDTLDAFAVTVHGYWPDPPPDDPALAKEHARGFERVAEAFPSVVAVANAHNRPGRFAAFAAYEWHSIRWGDYVVIFPGGAADLCRAANLEELKAFARECGALLIPHHVGYRAGWRGLDWASFDPSLSPVIEIFSEHGSSWDRNDLFPMTGHSMGGATTSQTVAAQLARGAHFGFVAGTDNHFGCPGSYGEGLTGLFVRERTREAIFEALRQRHTLAATGDRIELRVESNGAIAGDVLPAALARIISFEVRPLAPLDYVELVKNGTRAQVWPCPPPAPELGDGSETHLVRLEWGWGRMGEAVDTQWIVRVKAENGDLEGATPCLVGGPAGVDKRVSFQVSDGCILVESVTSRRDPLPLGGVVIRVRGTAATRLQCHVDAEIDGKSVKSDLGACLGELQKDDVWTSLAARFSAPKVRLGRAWPASSLAAKGTFRDERPGPRDTYVVKARQTNGQTVWASPLLFTN